MKNRQKLFVAQFTSTYPSDFAISMAVAAEGIFPLSRKHDQLISKKRVPKNQVDSVRHQILGIVAMRCPRLKVEWRESKPSVVIRYGRNHKKELPVV